MAKSKKLSSSIPPSVKIGMSRMSSKTKTANRDPFPGLPNANVLFFNRATLKVPQKDNTTIKPPVIKKKK